MAKRRNYKRDRNGKFARTGTALAKRSLGTIRTRPPTKTPSKGMSYKKAATLFGVVGVATVAYKRSAPGRKKRKAARKRRKANFRRTESQFAQSAAGRQAYGL